jgi:two-component system nitrogen regulation sensor histidine kinase GlnL
MNSLPSTTPGDFMHRRIMENMSASIMVLDADFTVVYINPACEMLFEISRRNAFGKHWQQLVIENHDLTARMQKSITQGHPFTERELQLEIYGNRIITVDCSVTPLYEPATEPSLLVELQCMERQLQISREESLIAQSHVVRDLIRGLAHEVKNPLGGLRGAAQLLERELDSEELQEYTQIIIAEADRLQGLVDRMLGPIALPHKRQVNIHQVLERVYALIKVEASDDIEIVRNYDPSMPEVIADPDQLIQAVLNLVSNAIQAMGAEGRLELRTRSKRQFTIGQQRYKLVAMIEIIDNGPGIPAEMMDRIFLPMITGRAEGTGLGLSIAQSLINRHDGVIECSSKPGKTVFRILLPLEKMNGEE